MKWKAVNDLTRLAMTVLKGLSQCWPQPQGLSFLLVVVLASKNGFPDTPSEAALSCDLLSCFFEIVHDRPADCGVLLRFCGLLLVLCELFGMLAYEIRIELLAVGLLFYEFRTEGGVH